jgi:hypothetical protein
MRSASPIACDSRSILESKLSLSRPARKTQNITLFREINLLCASDVIEQLPYHMQA